MRVRVLGRFEIEADGAAVAVPSGLVGRLLQVLLLRPNEVHSAGVLTDLLWPGVAPAAATRRLQVTVSRLRNVFAVPDDEPGAVYVSVDGDGYRLQASPASLDRLVFESLAAEAFASSEAEAIDRALAAWGGEPYLGFEWTAEVRSERARLMEMHRRLVEAKRGMEAGGPTGGFLRAKFRPPRLADPLLLTRPRLLTGAPLVGEVSVVTVTAPPGFGKSVFLAQWAQRQSTPVAWVSVDEDDNDPARFWASVMSALVESGHVDLATATRGLNPGSAAFIDALGEGLEARAVPLALVVDDFHELVQPAVHEQMAALLATLPDSATIAFGSRTDLPLPTSRLSAIGRLHRVGAFDLQFTEAEVEALVGDRDRAGWVWQRAGGWPMAVTALRRSAAGEVPIDVAEMSGYLVGEMLEALPTATVQFLFEIAHLDSFNAGLCSAVTGRDDAADALEQLSRVQAFVIESGSDTRWYRLHHLIGVDLRRRSTEAGVDARAVRARAARWFYDQGLRDEALRYAAAAGDRELVVATAGDVLVEAALRQQSVTCLRRLESIDSDDLANDLRSHSIATGLATLWGGMELRRSWARSRMRHWGGDDDLVLVFHDGVTALREGRTSESIALLERVMAEAPEYAADVAPELAPLLVGLAFGNLIDARLFHGSLHHDDPAFADAITSMRPIAPLVGEFVRYSWSMTAFADGNYELAASLAEEYYLGRRDQQVLFRPTRENSLIGALAAARGSDDPKFLRGLAEGLAPPLRLYERGGSYTWVAATRLAMAALYRKARADEQARRERDRAMGLMRTFPDAPFLDRLADRVDEIVAGEPRSAAALLEPLSPMERRVLAYLASDLTAGQIARELGLSAGTIRSHCSAIYRKLGVQRRHQAILKVGIDIAKGADQL